MKFNTQSSIFQFLGSLFDFVLLNLIFLITCIPVITIGPALSALYSVTLQEARGEHGYMLKPYLLALKENFRKGLVLFLLYLIAGAVLLFNLTFWLHFNTLMGNIALLIVTLCTVLYVLSFLYVFALNARFENPVKQTIKNSVLLALSNPKQSLFLFLILAIALGLTYIAPIFRVFLVIFGFAFLAYCSSFPLTKVFQTYEPEEDEEEEV